MHEAKEGRPDKRPDQGTPGDDAQARASDAARERVDADLETTARLGIEVGQLLFYEPFNRDSRELDLLIPAWARRFNAEHAGETWEGIEYTDTIALFALRRFREWDKGGPQC